jgi:hypothetical protein
MTSGKSARAAAAIMLGQISVSTNAPATGWLAARSAARRRAGRTAQQHGQPPGTTGLPASPPQTALARADAGGRPTDQQALLRTVLLQQPDQSGKRLHLADRGGMQPDRAIPSLRQPDAQPLSQTAPVRRITPAAPYHPYDYCGQQQCQQQRVEPALHQK